MLESLRRAWRYANTDAPIWDHLTMAALLIGCAIGSLLIWIGY